MIILAYGGGTNSTAILTGILQKELQKPDIILFADTGGEKPQTYQYIKIMQKWLKDNNFPPIEIVKGFQPQQKIDGGLYEECYRLGVLPSRVYGSGGCSMKWKKTPQDRFLLHDERVKTARRDGIKPLRLIGYDADEPHRADRKSFTEDKNFDYSFPLLEWDWGRDECIESILAAGLPKPGKSACFFCPSMKKNEILQLAAENPELADKAIELEIRASAKLTNVKGLGRDWAWRNLLKTEDMFGFDDISGLQDLPCDCFDGD